MGNVSVQDILNRPELNGARVLAGAKGLSRRVEAVTVGEIPDIANWLQGNDFVHSVLSFMDISKQDCMTEQELCRWVSALIDHGASCLAIKTKRYLQTVPASVLWIGNHYDFPIIELPPNGTQNKITKCIIDEILSDRVRLQTHILEFMNSLNEAMSAGRTAEEICAMISEKLDSAVLLEDAAFELIAASSQFKRPEMQRFLERRRAAFINSVMHEEAQTPVVLDVDIDDRTVRQETWFLRDSSRISGYITLIANSGDICPDIRALLEACVGALSLVIRSLPETRSNILPRYESKLIEALLYEQFVPSNVKKAAEAIGFSDNHERVAVAISLARRINAENVSTEYFKDFAACYLANVLRGRDIDYVLGEYAGCLLLIMDSCGKTLEEIKSMTSELRAYLINSGPGIDVHFAIGSIAQGYEGYRESCMLALDTIECIKKFRLDDEVICYTDLGKYEVLFQIIKDKDLARRYCERTLGTLTGKRSDDAQSALDTLKIYLSTNCSYVETGRIMFLHTNTVKYRIDKIQKAISVDLSTMDGKCAVWLALNVNKLLQQDTY